MNIASEIKPFDMKRLKELNPGECFMLVRPDTVCIEHVGVYMLTDERFAVNLKDGVLHHINCITKSNLYSDILVYPVVLEAILKAH